MNIELFKRVLSEKKLTQYEIATMLGISTCSFSRKLKDQVFSYKELIYLRKILGVQNFNKIFFD